MYPDDFAPLRPHFEGLTSNDEETRLEASAAILEGLEDKSTGTCHKVLDRLLKGLASGRKSARIGFSVTLTEFLIRMFGVYGYEHYKIDIGFSRLFELLQTHTKVTGNVSGQEERDHYLGRLFGLQAILVATVVEKRQNAGAEWIQLFDAIFELAIKKSWLREECGWIIYNTLEHSKVQVSPWGNDLAQVAIDRLCESQMARTPEGVAIWLTTRSSFRNVILPKQIWHCQDPLHVKNSSVLAQVMRESSYGSSSQTDGEDNRLQQRGMWNSRPNFAWTVILREAYLSRGEEKRLGFRSFWQVIVDENLFSASASRERKHWGFMLLSIVLRDAPSVFLPGAFSKNLVRCLINHLADRERYLYRTALKCIKIMQARVEEDPSTADSFVTGLIGSYVGGMNSYGSPLFDQLTKTKTIATFLAMANDSALEHIIILFDLIIIHPNSNDVTLAESYRRALADLLVSAIRSRKLEGSESWLESVLTMFSKFGYLDPKTTPPFSSSSRDTFRAKLSACLAHLLSMKTSVNVNWPFEIISYLKSEEESGCWHIIMEFDAGIEKVRKSAWKKIKRLSKLEKSATGRQAAHLGAFKLLYSLVMLQLYNGDSDALSVLVDLGALSDKLHSNTGEGDDNTSEVLVELLLGLVSKPSVLLRKVAQQVFGALTSELTQSSLQLLFDVLNTKESLAGQRELFDQDAQSEVENDANNEVTVGGNTDASSDSDEAMLDLQDGEQNAINGDEQDSGLESDESLVTDSDDDASDATGQDEETTKLNAALADIVGTRQFDQCMANKDDSSDDDDDDEMDDEQMFALDEQMAKVFKERKKNASKKKEGKDAKSNMIDFKNKVLDLLEIYVKQERSNPLSLTLILPLLSLMRSTTSKQIASRACNLIRDLSQKCKGKEIPVLQDLDGAWNLLREVHGEAMKDASRAHATACSYSSLMVVKMLISSDRSNIRDVVSIYSDTQTKWLLGQCRVQPLLFSDFINWSASFSQQS